ncbi:hypothetical protein EV127DRAFT_475057 [Xylaria flabelliformis]|nr:hypothetical protein EV127DRAFT_475057 [Xylaria flabelliformis]
MAPPPATPTPHRFLVPKRSQPHSETPSSQQFHATPRFTLHSTQRTGPSSSLTPFRHRATGRDVLIESSPPPLPSVDHVDDNDDHINPGERYEQGYVKYDLDSVIDENNVVQTSSPIRVVESDSEDGDRDEEKRVKRRRISSSPPGINIEDSYPLPEGEFEPDVQMRDVVSDVESSFTEPSISEDDMASDEGVLKHDTGESSPSHRGKRPLKAHQPTFQKAPRFKPSEIPEGAPRPEPLPDVFSPRRRGAKYVQGGLAAELRDWLVDVEAGTGSGLSTSINAKRNEEWVMRVRVDGLHGMNKSARGMTVVVGRQVLDRKTDASDDDRGQDEKENAVEVLGSTTIRIILAGPGRLSGLGIGNDVRLGVLLGIARPTWDVVLDGLGRFGVACDWVVLR